MAAQRPRRESRVPRELVVEILLRLPPSEPASLLRASLVCKAWWNAVSDPAFRRRLLELYPTAPVLGFLHNWEDQKIPRFIHATASPFSRAAPDCGSWRALDCRHHRALFLSKGQNTREILLQWDPITGSDQFVPLPAEFESSEYGAEKMSPTAAVFCAEDGCDHAVCHGDHFRLAFVFSVKVDTDDEQYVTSACLYSSKTGTWGEPTLMNGELSMNFTRYSSVLVDSSLLYFMSDDLLILEYDLATHSLNVFDPPDNWGYVGRFNIVLGEDGGLRVCQYLFPKLKLWTRNTSDDTDAEWVTSRAVFLDNALLPIGGLLDADSTVQVMGFAEEANVVFLNTANGIYTVELQSRQVKRVYDNRGFCNLIPVVGFYIPAFRGKIQKLRLSEEAGRQEEKTVDHEQKLFDKGSSAIKEGGQDLEIRDPSYGEIAPECASMEDKPEHAFPSEAQQVTDPMGEDPNSALNAELVKSTSTTNKDDVGNSKNSGSDVEDAAPTSGKGDS
uniref:Uncharacterized protein n=2 Tax=Avena sativa TaxID=4498 RepID=A0ACD5WH16_AVESA